MSYTYKYIPSSIKASAQKGTNPKQQYIDLFQETINEQFYNSADWWTVQEEIAVGSRIYANVDVRITHLINAETGLKLGDDWKTVLFKDVDHPIFLGRHYIFDNNTWLVTNTEYIKNLTGTCTIRRCNNTLRWIDTPTGTYYEEPCAIEYLVKEPRNYITQGSPFPTPGGFLHIEMQLNERSGKISENQRFLFGNSMHWTAYRVVGTGINDFRNQQTYDNNSSSILTLDLIADFVNDELDDVINGIADVYTNVYYVYLSSASISGSPTSTFQLTPSVIYNGDSVTRSVDWVSSDETVATVSASGIVTLNTVGTCTVSASLVGNPASATCWVTVTNTPTINYEIIINPDTNYVLEGSSRTYSAYLYENNIVQSGSFIFTCNGSNVPSTSYVFTQVDGNHFRIQNVLRSLTSHLIVECTTGSVVSPKEFDIYLRGAWQYDNT